MKKIILSGLLACSLSANITDGHFSTNQIFDVQYYWSGTTLNASSFIAPYNMNFVHPTVTSGQYFAFFNSTTNPGTYGLGLYNADNTLAQVVHNTGTLQAIGPNALFYIGSGFFGTVISTSAGYSYGQSASFTNMDTSVTASDLTSYTWASTTPLAAGQVASSTPTLVAVSTPSTPPTPTLVSSSSSVITSTSNAVDSSLPVLTTNATQYISSVSGNVQNIARNVTTTVTTPMITTTSSYTHTVDTYSDSSTVASDSATTTTTNSWNDVTTSNSTLPTLTGRIDGMSTLYNVNKLVNRTFNDEVQGVQAIKHSISFKNSSTANVDGYAFGGSTKVKDIKLGATLGLFDSKMSSELNGTSKSSVLSVYGVKEFDKVTAKLSYTYIDTSYDSSRTIGDFSNSSSTDGKDKFANLTFTGKYSIEPIVGYTVGKRNLAGYTEQGSFESALVFDSVNDNYRYYTVGAQKTLGDFVIKGVHYTDNISDYSVVYGKEFGRARLNLQVQRLISDFATDTSIKAGLLIKF